MKTCLGYLGSLLLAVIFCLAPKMALARDGSDLEAAAERRVWRSATGSVLVEGRVVSLAAGMVRVETAEGKRFLLRVNQLSPADQRWLQGDPLETTSSLDVAGPNGTGVESKGIAAAFQPFEKLGLIKTRSEKGAFFVESNGLPSHQLMVGIKTWQQQVPLPQKYVGDNAWRIPLDPKLAANPASTKGRFLRGAIAIGVNGIPIFNPLNNRGADSSAIGELDEWGGHCGRADDYHYHLAPVHLEETVGKGKPIAYGLDGYPIYGYTEPDGSPVKDLDECHGHFDAAGGYHYHAATKYPYFIGAFRGEVVEKEGQVDPQPRAEGVRPDTRPLPGAKITGFERQAGNRYVLTYEQAGKPATVAYEVHQNGSVTFEFTDTDGKKTTETYSGRPRRGGPRGQQGPPAGAPSGRGPPGSGRPSESGRGGQAGPLRGNRNLAGERPPRDPAQTSPEEQPPLPPPPRPPQSERPAFSERLPVGNALRERREGNKQAVQPPRRISSTAFNVASESVDEKGFLDIDCTCDGKGATPEIHWGDLPEGTKSLAVSVWHTAPDREKSYWLVFNIPANAKGLELNSKEVGQIGVNDKRQAGYDPPCSQGPGVKTYHVSVFALSRELDATPQSMNRAKLLELIADCTLAEGLLDFKVERK